MLAVDAAVAADGLLVSVLAALAIELAVQINIVACMSIQRGSQYHAPALARSEAGRTQSITNELYRFSQKI